MQKFFAVELLLITSIFYVKSGECVKCYDCRSDDNKGCGTNSSLAKECGASTSSSKVLCRKIHQLLKFKDQTTYTSIRECGYSKGPHDCYFLKWPAIAYQVTCECESDLCNRANTKILNIIEIAIVFLIWIYIYDRHRL